MRVRIAGVSAAIVVAMCSGCAITYTQPDPECNGGASSGYYCSLEVKSAATGGQVFGSLASIFNAALVRVDVSESNVSLLSANGNVTVKLKLNGATLTSASFPYYQSGTQVLFSNPAQVNAWVHANAGNANGYDLDFDNFHFSAQTGLNSVVIKYLYDNQVQTGGAWSTYNDGSGGGGYPPPHQQ